MSTMRTRHFIRSIRLQRERVPSFAAYPFSLPAVRNLDRLTLNPDVTFLIGENGSGKSTLLEAIAVSLGFNAEGGSRNFRFATRSSHSQLHEYVELERGLRKPRDGYFLRAESYFNVATEIERLDEAGGGPPIINSYGGRSLHEQSHGESFMALVLHRFGGDGLYLLDEPEAALSPTRQLALLTRMHQLVQSGSQFLIATHSPLLLAFPGARIYSLDADGIEETAYEQTEHYQITRRFLSDHEGMLRRLFE